MRSLASLLAYTASTWLLASTTVMAQEALLPPEGAVFAFVANTIAYESKNTKTNLRLEYQVKHKSDSGVSVLIQGDQPAVEYDTDRQQNILLFTGEGTYYTGYEPYRPYYFSPLRPGSERIEFYHFTYERTDPKKWYNCASLISTGARTTYTLGSDKFDAIELNRIDVCNQPLDKMQVETETEIFCLDFNFNCSWTYTQYMGKMPQPDFVEAHLNSEQDFELLRRKLVFFDKTYGQELRLLSVHLP
jgi:hypothetical protein